MPDDSPNAVTITVRFRGRLPVGVDAEKEAKDLAQSLSHAITYDDAIPTDFRVEDAWVCSIKDER